MIHLHLYGKLRRFAEERDACSDSIVSVPWRAGDTVEAIVERIGISREELGSNIFLNGRYATLASPVADGDRLGLFPDDMQLLYKWYFAPPPAAEPSFRSTTPKASTGYPAARSGSSKSSKERKK